MTLAAAEAEPAAVADELVLLDRSWQLLKILPGARDEYRQTVEELEAAYQEEPTQRHVTP